MSFVGTPNCYVCNKKVYPVERMDADKKTFHKYAPLQQPSLWALFHGL
jgi:hypothetical protein